MVLKGQVLWEFSSDLFVCLFVNLFVNVKKCDSCGGEEAVWTEQSTIVRIFFYNIPGFYFVKFFRVYSFLMCTILGYYKFDTRIHNAIYNSSLLNKYYKLKDH